MGYTPWSVSAGEQPTTSKWNVLGSNDASFSDGTGINANAIKAAQLALSSGFTGGVATQVNAGSAGGTMYYVNLGGIKLLWCVTSALSLGTGGITAAITLPTSFFSTVQFVLPALNTVTVESKQWVEVTAQSASSISLYMLSNSNGATQSASVFVIGT